MNARHRKLRNWARATLLAAGAALISAAWADFQVTGPDGRRILLKDDKTWSYVEADPKDAAKEKEPPKERPREPVIESDLYLERRVSTRGGCAMDVRLSNNFPYEIRQFVPAFAAYRANGVVYDNVTTGFFAIKPGNYQTQEVLFRGITCEDIKRVQVIGGDRCSMGDLDRFSLATGDCLSRIRVVASQIVRFDK